MAIVWDGEVDVHAATPGPADCTNGDRIAGVTAGTLIELKDGVDAARVAVLGLDTTNRQVGTLPRGAHPFPNVDDSSRQITFILRHFHLTPEFESIPLEGWPRPGYLLTTIDGPRVEARDSLELAERSELDFVLLPSNEWLKLRRGGDRDETAFLFDYYVTGDPAPSILQGCTYRCWGRGGL
ncbi:MAG: hypothetical protein KC438_03350 [Thermomicrobiales bacterium]|nr:hypothetical protein [Thermomicrobiales bacterium]